MKSYLTKCYSCGRTTNRKYASSHKGCCKSCAEGVPAPSRESSEDRQGRLIDSGWNAYAREEGYYDLPNWA